MLKYILFIALSLFMINAAKCQKADTTITYFKYDQTGTRLVGTRAEADFIRMVLPPDAGDNRVNVHEIYRDGKIKFTGKYYADYTKTGSPFQSGECISYYPTGKKQSIVNFTDGRKDGDEYLYYPNGSIYCRKKNIIHNEATRIMNLECYDAKGNMICKDGNGEWIAYDSDFVILLQGPVKNGLFEGDWHGATHQDDSIKYVYKYKKGLFVSGIGYDKNGTAYPFLHDVEPPSYSKDPIFFLQLLRSHMKIPKDADGKKLKLDGVYISFVLEKDGSLTSPEVIGNWDPALTDALKNALLKCKGWKPRTYYGIPLRSKLILPYKEFGGFEGDQYYVRTIQYEEQILGF